MKPALKITRKKKFFFTSIHPIYLDFGLVRVPMKRALKITRKKNFFFRFFSKCRNATWVFFVKIATVSSLATLEGWKSDWVWFLGRSFRFRLSEDEIRKKWKKNSFFKILDLTDLVSLVQIFEKNYFFYFLRVITWIWKSATKNIPRLIFSPLGSLQSSQCRFSRKKNQANPSTKIAL